MPEGLLPPPTVNFSDTGQTICTEDILRAIKSSRKNLVTAIDRISSEKIKHTMVACPPMLTQPFNSLLRHRTFPAEWKEAKCILIPKPGRADLSMNKNLRPIPLLSCMGKTFEKLLTRQVVWAGKLTSAISAEHMGSWARL